MTSPTPRDSAQLPPHFLQSGVFSGEHHKWVIDYAERYAREALRAQAASVEPYGQVTANKHTGQYFFYRWPQPPYLDNSSECITVYAGAPPAHIPADADERAAGRAEAFLKAVQPQSSPATAVDAVELLQAGLSNDDLRAAFESKLPGVNPTERDLSIFALGAEVGAHELATERQSTRMYFEERNSARDAWRRAASCRDELRAALQASRQPQAQQGGGEGEVGYLYGFDRSDLSAMADGLDCHEQTVDGLQTTTAAAAQFIRAALQACAGDDAKILEWLLPNIHPANFGLDYDKEHYENDVVGAWKKAILNDLATTKGRP